MQTSVKENLSHIKVNAYGNPTNGYVGFVVLWGKENESFIFRGTDETDVRNKAIDFLTSMREIHRSKGITVKPLSSEPRTEAEIEDKPIFTDTVWMYNPVTKARIRILENESDAYKADGFTPGRGPNEAPPPKISIRPPSTGKNAGKIWVVNQEKKERYRILPSDLPTYEGRGFVKGKKF